MLLKGIIKTLANQSGQALLIIVLVMVVALTIGLSVASRTITNLRNTQEQASSQKALSAAEAGVEQAIKNSANVAGSLNTTTSYTTSIQQVLGTAPFKLNGGIEIPKNDAIYVWLSPYSTNPSSLYQTPWTGSLTIYWEDKQGDCNNSSSAPAAIEIALISGTKTSPSMSRYAYDPCSNRANLFSAASPSSATVAGTRFYYQATLSITNGLLLRINPLYSQALFAVAVSPGSPALPSQGSVITSTGTTNSDPTTATTRKVTVFQGYPEIPAEFFPYTLFQP